MKMLSDSCSLFFRQPPCILGNSRLREPQQQAYQELRKHFSVSTEPALVQIPVGCGKTGLMAILPFGIARGRVLIVAPNLTIREALFRAVDSASASCFWRKMAVSQLSPEGPFAAKLDGADAQPSDCDQSHFVVSNVQQIGQSRSRWLDAFPDRYFDMILLDEGHHNAAASWQRLIQKFPHAKIISLTATPFRSDGLELTGKMVYQYPFLRAMCRGYIKTLRAVHVAPQEISFTYRDGTKECSLEEILKLREEQWFSRGVALAPECNRHIVRTSIEQCQQLRAARGSRQQIIAVACSVEHAQQIAALYREAGFATEAIHSQQTKRHRGNILNRLKSGQLDCIVQVQMLGEGFDHPPLSVAAVFRPFRSLSPYVQFVGRIMRVMRQERPGDPDNQGVVVSHVGMNTERHWEDFRQLDDSDQKLWAGLAGVDESSKQKTDGRRNGDPQSPQIFSPEMLVAWEVLGEFQKSQYAHDQTQQQSLALEESADTHSSLGSVIAGPQQRRRESKSRLQQEVNHTIRAIHHKTRLPTLGMQIGHAFSWLRRQNNWAAVRFWVYKEMKKRLGPKTGPSREWSLDEIEQAIDLLPEIGQEIQQAITKKITRRPAWPEYDRSSNM